MGNIKLMKKEAIPFPKDKRFLNLTILIFPLYLRKHHQVIVTKKKWKLKIACRQRE
jgi:hypothetical protein